MSYDPKAPLSILDGEGHELAHILSNARLLAQVQTAFQALLAPALAKHCQVANTENHTLTILVNSGTTATQLKFMSDDLLAKFKETPLLAPYRHLNIKVRPPLAPSQKQRQTTVRRPANPLSAENAAQVREAAMGIEDEGLKAAMLRLSKRKI